MGNYNSQYESYYSKFTSNKRNYNPYSNYSYRSSVGSKNKANSSYFSRRLLRELIGVLCLLFLILICKTIVTPQTAAVYNYSKHIVNQNYDFTYLINKAKSLNITGVNTLQQNLQEMIETLKIKITGGETIKEKVKKNFITPVKGQVLSSLGESGIVIDVVEGSEVNAVFDGTVKECGESKELGKYILINHGSGLESRYSDLSEIVVSKNSDIKKGDVIAKTGSTGKLTTPHLYFELFYMGESKNPLDYIEFDVQ